MGKKESRKKDKKQKERKKAEKKKENTEKENMGVTCIAATGKKSNLPACLRWSMCP